MNNIFDENKLLSITKVALFNVRYLLNQEENVIVMVLKTGKKYKNQIRRMIATIVDVEMKNIRYVKANYRKFILGYKEGLEGTQRYHEFINLKEVQKKKNRAEGVLKRKYTIYKKKHTYKPKSVTAKFVQERYTGKENLFKKLKEIHGELKLRYLLDIQFDYLLRDVATGEERPFYPSDNTSIFGNKTLPVINNSLNEIFDILENNNIVDAIRTEKSSWSVDSIYEYVILTFPLEEMPIGARIELPKYIIDSKSILSFESDNNMCFWNCLARHQDLNLRSDRMRKSSLAIFDSFYKTKINKNYKGIDFEELSDIELFFNININIYRYNGVKAYMERHSAYDYESTLNLNIFTEIETNRHHFSYITNIKTLIQVFQCPDCNKFLSECGKLKQHALKCNQGNSNIYFEGGIYQPTPNIFKQMATVGVHVPIELKFYQYFIFYDFETWLKPYSNNKIDSKLQFKGT